MNFPTATVLWTTTACLPRETTVVETVCLQSARHRFFFTFCQSSIQPWIQLNINFRNNHEVSSQPHTYFFVFIHLFDLCMYFIFIDFNCESFRRFTSSTTHFSTISLTKIASRPWIWQNKSCPLSQIFYTIIQSFCITRFSSFVLVVHLCHR